MIELFERIRTLIYYTTRTIHFFHQQNFIKAHEFSQLVLMNFQKSLKILQKENLQEVYQDFLLAIQMILEETEKQDEIKLADIYQLEILPFLYQVLNNLCGESENLLEGYWEEIKENYWEINQRIIKRRFPEIWSRLIGCKEKIPDEYRVSLARTGEAVLEIATEDNGIVRMNSACDPMQEALAFAENYKEAGEYLVIGWGMGLHVWALLQQPSCRKVVVLENDIYPLAISLMYQNWDWDLNDERLSIVYCTDNAQYFKYWNQALDKLKICIWYPSVRAMRDRFTRGKLESAKITLSSMENMENTLNSNFELNMEKRDEEVSSLQKSFAEKTVLFIAAGPSLDDEIEKLRQSNLSNYILVCVGKIAAKLIQNGIKPDYIIIIDAQASTRWQINNIEECGVPLIYISTAAFNIIEAYKGKRYIAFQEGFDKAEEYAKEQGYPLYQQGGSVSTFALDLLIQFKCSRIICIGLDMGYPGERTHAAGVGSDLVDKTSLYKIEGIDSKDVYTSRPLDMYRQWIEKRISGVKGIELINVSKGARIHGMKEMKLEEALCEK